MPRSSPPGKRSRASRTRRLLAAGLAAVLTATILQVAQTPAVAGPANDRPAVPDDGKPAPARPAPKGLTNLPDKALTLAERSQPATAWPKAASAEIAVQSAGSVGGMKVRAAKAGVSGSPKRIRVQTFGKEVSDRAKVSGPVLRVGGATGKVKLSLDYATYAGRGSGDRGGRLTLVALPECALTTPDLPACAPEPLKTVNDTSARTLTAEVGVAAASTLVAMSASSSSSTGDFGATSLAPSSKWDVATSSGAFSWSYPMRVPPVPGGFGPGVSLSYNSQSIDGRTATTNNQGSWVGEGFGFEPGYVERRYKACKDDGHSTVGDLCWSHENLTMSLNGSSAELVKSGNTWKLANDNGSKIEKLTGAVNGDAGDGTVAGEHWKLTTTDGYQYYFGLNQLPGWNSGKPETNSTWTVPVFGDDATNTDDGGGAEPCYKASFASAWCQQAWRWNLDYAVDRHGNVMTYYYEKEKNAYARNVDASVNGTEYDRGGYLKRIEYGQREGAIFTQAAAARVVFDVAERCDPTVNATACAAGNLTDATSLAWPDVPFDRICAPGGKCKTDQTSPTFFTRKRLATVTTEIRNGTSSFAPVDKWTLGHLYPDNGDGSNSLWLHTIKQEGVYGTGSALNGGSVRLDLMLLPNRILQDGEDMLGDFVRPRLAKIYNDTGGQTEVVYAEPNCATGNLPKPGESTRRCFPVKWEGAGFKEPVTDWFNKYVVESVRETDLTDVDPDTILTPDMVTFYDYLGDAAWRYPDPDGITEEKYRTWSEWRGYAKVRVSKGTDQVISTRSEHYYLQGMDGDKDPDGGTRDVKVTDSAGVTYTDAKEFVGFEYETKVLDGTSSDVISKATSSPIRFETASHTRSFGTDKATFVRTETKRGFTPLPSGGQRETKTVTKYDATWGRVTEVNDLGDVSTSADDTCGRTYYADNDGKNIRSLAYRTETVAVNCSTTPNRAKDVLSDGRTYFDGGALGAAPTRGLTTKTERLTAHNGTTGTYAMVSEGTFDAYARPLTAKDAKGVVSRFAYTETNGLTTRKQEFSPKISVKGATAAEFVTTTDYNPAWGLTTVQKDWNDKVTTSSYDKLGRLTQVLLPDRAVSGLPTMKYTYVTDPGKPVVVRTEKPDVEASKTQVEYQIFDGFMRPRQLQVQGPNGGRLVSDTWYNGIGSVDRTSEPYFAAGAPAGQLLPTEHADTDQETGYVYDGAGRISHTITFSKGKELWRSSTAYEGDRAHLTPPKGGTATTSISDARGRMVQLWHYEGGTPTGTHKTTFYDYTPAGQLAKVTDPDGNIWASTYDQVGRKVTSSDPDAGTTSFGYDVVDRLTSTQDARGRKIETVYDDLGRVTGTFEVAGTTRTQLTKNVYDSLMKGQPYSSTRYVNGQEYITATTAMDNLYRPLRSIYSIPADAGTNLAGVYTFNSSYNADGTQQGFTYPATKGLAAEPVVYTYDNLKRVTGITGATSYVTDVKYTDTGEVTQAQLDTGKRKAWVTLDYETSTKRLQKLMVKRESYVSSQNPVPDRPSSDIYQEYRYDQVGNILSVADTPGSGVRDVQCFTYDHLRRMTDAYSTAGVDCSDTTVGGVAPYHSSYEYDETGNRTKETLHGASDVTRDYTYATGHAVQSITEKAASGSKLYSYKYDKSGNTLERTEAGSTQKLDWDAEGSLSAVTNADGKKTSFVYSAGGDRLIRKEPGFTTLYLPGMELRLNTASGVVEDTRFIALAGGAVAIRTAKGVQFQVSDANGTGQAAIDATTGAITMRRTTPFGGDRGAAPAAGAWYGEKGFVGGTKDSTTGLTHLGAREYDPKTGRFISVDPVLDVTDPQQMNGYAYANNSPVTFTDPSGLKFCSDDYCGPGADWVDSTGKLHEEEGDNDGKLDGNPNDDKDVNDSDNALPEPVKKAKKEEKRVKREIAATAKVLGKIIADELGITDAVDCFTKGDIGGCVNTAINVVMAAIGGAAGKLVARYAFKINKLKEVVGSLWRLGNRMKRLVGEFFANRKALKAAGCHSFAPSTLVLLADGSTKRIKDLVIGDEVVATDPETGETADKEVVATHINQDKEFTDLQVKDEKGVVSELKTTVNHPFWSLTDKAWVEAVDLESGDRLTSTNGGVLTVERTRSYIGLRTMYDITVDDIHTYFVLAGTAPVLVHNCEITDLYRVSPEARGASEEIDGLDPANFPRDGDPGFADDGSDGSAYFGNRARVEDFARRNPGTHGHGFVVRVPTVWLRKNNIEEMEDFSNEGAIEYVIPRELFDEFNSFPRLPWTPGG
ncbi:hypothetical protein ACTI_46940 [Actinoplanes sp. OR16]|uniref:polymorphic toxin-type HINT domain-containing protein n=1 Tax=Actinoplanes sp. OR16 TaxID=946334 RepID=UPI000F6DD5E8|nr:polymorphic toxin-type HINT domain-containing protein [Actinoplanes sp. OR16]BBH68009.1 hypothetical protein ACTI_46940 [Actinoplanes sp. OR16]